MGSDPVTVVANSVRRHYQSIDLGVYDSAAALQPYWNEVVLHHVGNTFVVVFVEDHSLRGLAVHLAKRSRVRHCRKMYRPISHQWHHTTHLQKSSFGSCFQQFHEDYRDPINGTFLVLLTPLGGKMGLVGEQNVLNHMGVRINPMAQFKPAAHVRRWTWEKNYSSEFSALQEATTMLQCFIRLQVIWSHQSENVSKQFQLQAIWYIIKNVNQSTCTYYH